MTSTQMRKAEAKSGYWWVNVAPLGEVPDWQEQVAPLPEADTLFGYQPQILMAKQYRAA